MSVSSTEGRAGAMFQPWRLQLRQAEAAWRAGRLDEAGRLLAREGLDEFLPAKELSLAVSAALVERGERHASAGDTLAGWRDLEAALRLSGETATLLELRRRLVEQALAEAERFLAAEDATAALACLERLNQRHCETATTRLLGQVARRVQAAGRLIRRGELLAAEAELAAALQLRPDLRAVENRLAQCRVQLKPGCVETHPTVETHAAVGCVLTHPIHLQQADTRRIPIVADVEPQPKFIAWVDAVGGYLVCLGDQVILGQPVAGGPADVAILADLSRRHAVIRRDGETYAIAPLQRTLLDGRELSAAAPLADGSQIELGDGVKLRFRRPHPLSATAVLDFVSHHRTRPKVDGVILMAQTCIFGPQPSSHVVCRNWANEAILYREGKNLGCRTKAKVEIDGQVFEGRGPLTLNSQVRGPDFAFCLEAAGGWGPSPEPQIPPC